MGLDVIVMAIRPIGDRFPQTLIDLGSSLLVVSLDLVPPPSWIPVPPLRTANRD
ncbi:hypothetical protein PC116_g30318 [Phytophthora cactorum]|nr:hypothetical protein PC116_g30318 [Phytophthora cactorum]